VDENRRVTAPCLIYEDRITFMKRAYIPVHLVLTGFGVLDDRQTIQRHTYLNMTQLSSCASTSPTGSRGVSLDRRSINDGIIETSLSLTCLRASRVLRVE